jgi:hypothetical protein
VRLRAGQDLVDELFPLPVLDGAQLEMRARRGGHLERVPLHDPFEVARDLRRVGQRHEAAPVRLRLREQPLHAGDHVGARLQLPAGDPCAAELVVLKPALVPQLAVRLRGGHWSSCRSAHDGAGSCSPWASAQASTSSSYRSAPYIRRGIPLAWFHSTTT